MILFFDHILCLFKFNFVSYEVSYGNQVGNGFIEFYLVFHETKNCKFPFFGSYTEFKILSTQSSSSNEPWGLPFSVN